MQSFSHIDETFDIDLSLNYKLSIQLCLNGFSFSVFDTARKKFIYLEHINTSGLNTCDELFEKLKIILKNNDYLNLEYKQVKAIVHANKSTIVPSELFNISSAKDIFSFNHNRNPESELFYNLIVNNDSFLISEANSKIITLLKEKFNNVKIYHQATSFIESNLSLFKNKLSVPKVFINKSKDYVDIIVLKDNKLLLHNTFNYKSLEDFVFNVMYIYEQLKLNSTEVELLISGNIDKKAEEIKLLKKYIKTVSILFPSKIHTYSYTFKQIPIQTYTNLFNLQACE